MLKSIIFLLGSNAASYLILLFISIIIFRTVDKSFYGLYVVLLSLFAVVELLMAGFNDTIVRFLKDKIPLSDKQNIIFFVLIYKYLLILLFILFTIIARKYGFFEYLISNYNEIKDDVDSFLLIVILNGIFSVIIGVNNCILNSQLEYKYTANIALIRNISFLVIVIILSLNTSEYLYYLYSGLLVSASILLMLSFKIFNEFNEFSIASIIKSNFHFNTGKKYIFSYAAPLTISSLLTYVKNYLPTLILGKEFSLDDVAVFSILKTFFKALHSVSASFIDPMMAKFLELKNNSEDFAKKMQYILYSTFILRFISFAVFSAGMSYFFIIYNIEDTFINGILFNILGVEYVLAGVMLSYGMVLKLDNNTKKILLIQLIRFVVELLLIYFILIDYGILAAGLILLVARYAETIAGYFIIRTKAIFRLSGLLILVFAFPVGISLYQIQLIFS